MCFEILFIFSQITDVGVAHLRGLTNLILLDLTATKVKDAALKHLRRLTNLIYLSLVGTFITGAGLAHLSPLVNLRELDLNNTQIANADLIHLRDLVKLTELNLAWCRGITADCRENWREFVYHRSQRINFCRRITDAGLSSLGSLYAFLGNLIVRR